MMVTTWIMVAIAAAYISFNTGLMLGLLARRLLNFETRHPKDWSRWSLIGIGWVAWCLLVGLEHIWCNRFSSEDRAGSTMAAIVIATAFYITGFIIADGGNVWPVVLMFGCGFVMTAAAFSALGVWAWRVFCGVVNKAESVAIMRSAGDEHDQAGGLTEVE